MLANGQNTAIISGGAVEDLILEGAGNTATISGGMIRGIYLDYIGANDYLMTQEYFLGTDPTLMEYNTQAGDDNVLDLAGGGYCRPNHT